MMKNLLIVLTLVVTGCAQTQPVKLPSLELSTRWRTGPTADTNGAAWWKAFGDATLDRLESEVLAENLDIRQAEARIEQARAAAGIAEAALAPTIGMDGSIGNAQQSLNSGLGALSKFVPNYARSINPGQLGISGSWDLDVARRLSHQREAADALMLASAAEFQATRLAISAEVADAYISMQAAQMQKSALLRQLDLVGLQNNIMQTRVRVGAAAQQDLDRFNSSVEELTAALPMLDATFVGQKNRLAVLLGHDATSWVFEINGDNQIPISNDPAGGLPVDLLGRRPDLLAAEQRVAIASANMAASMAEYYPSVSFSTALGQVSGDYAKLNSSSSSFAQSYFGIRWRLFDFGRIDSEVRVAKGKQKEALLAYRSAVLRATSEVETGFSQLAAARRQLQHIEAQLENTRLVAQSVNSSYQVGASSEDDALAAKRASAKLEFDVVSARRDVARAIIASSRALGGPIARP